MLVFGKLNPIPNIEKSQFQHLYINKNGNIRVKANISANSGMCCKILRNSINFFSHFSQGYFYSCLFTSRSPSFSVKLYAYIDSWFISPSHTSYCCIGRRVILYYNKPANIVYLFRNRFSSICEEFISLKCEEYIPF